MIYKRIELSNYDIKTYNNQLKTFISRVENKSLVSKQTFDNLRDNALELSSYLPQTTNDVDCDELGRSLAYIEKAIPLMSPLDSKLANDLTQNKETIKKYLDDNGYEIIELAKPTIKDCTDYKKISENLIKELLSDNNEEPTLTQRMNGYIPESIHAITKDILKDKDLPTHLRRTSPVLERVAEHCRDVMSGKTEPVSQYHNAIDEFLVSVCSKMNADRKEQKRQEKRKYKMFSDE